MRRLLDELVAGLLSLPDEDLPQVVCEFDALGEDSPLVLEAEKLEVVSLNQKTVYLCVFSELRLGKKVVMA